MIAISQRICHGFAVVLLAVTLAAPAFALTEEEASALTQISAKLNGIHTMNGDFVQFGPTGERTEGRFYMKRPGRIRFQYAPPNKLSVIADGDQVLIHDRGMQTYDLWPLKRTPLKFLLDDEIDLATAEQVREVYLESDLVQLVLVDDSRFGGGTLVLFFDRLSNDLRQWTVIDQQGLETSVAIYNVQVGQTLDGDLFTIDYSAATIAARNRGRNR